MASMAHGGYGFNLVVLINVLSTRPNIRTCTGRTGSCNGRDALSRLWTPAVGLMQCAMKPKTENRKPKPTHTCYDDNENATLVPYTMRILRYYAVRRTWLYTYTTVLRSATNVAIVYTYTTVTVLRSETNVAGRWRPGYCLVDISPRGV